MSFKVANLVYSRKIGSAHRKAILAYMADKASDDGRGVYCSKGTIADETEIARSTVFKTIKELVAEGLLIEAGHRACTNGSTVVYDLNLVLIAAFPPVSNQSVSRTRPKKDQSEGRTRPSVGLVREADTSPGAGPHQSASRTPTSPGAGPKPSLELPLNIGGGDSGANSLRPDPTWREQMLIAMGSDASGIVNARPTTLGSRIDMTLAERWQRDLGLDRPTILTVIRETMARKTDGPPSSFRYFDKAMGREASRLAEPPLQPSISMETRNDRPSARDRRQQDANDRLQRRLHAAARID